MIVNLRHGICMDTIEKAVVIAELSRLTYAVMSHTCLDKLYRNETNVN